MLVTIRSPNIYICYVVEGRARAVSHQPPIRIMLKLSSSAQSSFDDDEEERKGADSKWIDLGPDLIRFFPLRGHHFFSKRA